MLSPRRAAWLLLARPDQLTEDDLRVCSALPDLHPDIHSAASTAQRFAQLVRNRLPDAFDEWLQHSLQSTLREIRTFAGHLHRLKFVKRQMLGRAKFDLLRLRVLA